MHETLPSYDIVDHAADDAVFFYGPPSRLHGSVRLSNKGDEVVVSVVPASCSPAARSSR